MSRLQVCVDLMDFPSGSVIVIGLAAGRMFTAGAPATRKFPVAPESESAHLTALVTFSDQRLYLRVENLLNFLSAPWYDVCFRHVMR